MSWSLCKGSLEDGTSILALIDDDYASPKARAGRETLLVIDIPGPLIFESPEYREAVVETAEPFLAAYDGVHVAGVTRFGSSYRFLFYLRGTPDPSAVPLPEDAKTVARVWIARDPGWTEYVSFLPTRQSLLKRVGGWLVSKLGLGRRRLVPDAKSATASPGRLEDDDVLDALAAAGSDLSKETDIVFYLYIPRREDTDACASALWEHGFRAQVMSPLGKLEDGSRSDNWGIKGRIEAVPTREMILKTNALMDEIARRFDGEYDGWEAAIAR